MEIAEEMEIEEEKTTPNQTNFKRFGLKNSIQTNFGEDYVFEIVAKYDSLLNSVHHHFFPRCFWYNFCSYGEKKYVKLNFSETTWRRWRCRFPLMRWSCTRRWRGSTLVNAEVIRQQSTRFLTPVHRLRTCCIPARLILRSELGTPGLFNRFSS